MNSNQTLLKSLNLLLLKLNNSASGLVNGAIKRAWARKDDRINPDIAEMGPKAAVCVPQWARPR